MNVVVKDNSKNRRISLNLICIIFFSLFLFGFISASLEVGTSGQIGIDLIPKNISSQTTIYYVNVTALNNLSDLNIPSPTNNDVLRYDSATSKWINQQLSQFISFFDSWLFWNGNKTQFNETRANNTYVNIDGDTMTGNLNITGNLSLGNGQIRFNDSSKTYNYFNGSNWYNLIGGVPANTISAFNQANCPAGWVLADGTQGTPDLRGIFIRGAGTNGQITASNGSSYTATYGSYKNDSIQGHKHSETWVQAGGSIASGSGFIDNAIPSGVPITDGTNGAPRTSYETAPASYALIYCMKASDDLPSSNLIWQTSGDYIVPANVSLSFAINSTSFVVNATSGNVGIGTESPETKLDVAGGYIRAKSGTYGFPSSGEGIEMAGYNGIGYLLTYNRTDSSYMQTNIEGNPLVLNSGSGGNVGIGTASPSLSTTNAQNVLHVNSAGTVGEIRLTDSTTGVTVSDGSTWSMIGNDLYFWNRENSFLSFGTNNTERVRILSGGNVGIGTTSPTWKFSVDHSTNDDVIAGLRHLGTSPYGIYIHFPNAITDDNTHYALAFADGAVTRAILYSDGDWYNHDNTYGAISDERFKSNIENVSSQLNKLNSLRVVNYTLYENTNKNGNGKQSEGFIAQEMKEVYPELVSNITWNNESVLAINTMGLVPKLVESIKELFTWNTNQDATINQMNQTIQIQQAEIISLQAENQMIKLAFCRNFPQDALCNNGK